MQYHIEAWPAFTISGFKTAMQNAEALSVIPNLWCNAVNDGSLNRLLDLLHKADCRPAGLLGVCACGGRPGEMDYYLAVTIHVDVPECTVTTVPEDLRILTVPAGTWMIIEANGALPAAVQDVFKNLDRDGLPDAAYDWAPGPCIECYFDDNRQEVWVPVVKKS